jgi:adenosine kinase
MTILCTGSVAVDHIMVHRGRFKDSILPDNLHVLNVAFHVPELRRSFGGTAANIGFNLKLLGEEPIVLATVGGEDFDAYAAWLDRHGVRRDHIVALDDEATAGAYIITDLDDNQITGFHPGAMDRAHEAPASKVLDPIEIGIVSPNGKQAMIDHAVALKARDGVMTVVDPGQGIPLFEGPELLALLSGADLYIVNDYEWTSTQERTGLGEEALTEKVGRVVVTRGVEGSMIRDADGVVDIPSIPAAAVVDPTGCGDAYRAGLLHGIGQGLPIEQAARIGSLMGSLMVENPGTQSIVLSPAALQERIAEMLGDGA